MRPFVIHAHFYQPERHNPWTGALDPEPSAAPHRDWNQRIHDECYRPNAVARIFDQQRRVERIVNNFERLSFNIGPTLLRWLEGAEPSTYAKVIDGDWRSVARTGHGNAFAQAYNHMILPLANPRDQRTQIAWGLADFRHRFGRQATGMWLPETAASPETIDGLIDAGVRFTVLAPHQAHRVRHQNGEWHEVGAGIDTGRPYRHPHSDGSGRALSVFFYDGGLAQSLAFDPATMDAAVLLDRLHQAAERTDGLIHAALDGETFGHHHPFGELGLAYALFEEAERRGLEPTTYAAWLDRHPPVDEVQLVPGEGTAWSCAHGLGRWIRDCGCATDSLPGWNQAWRGPLRAALDVVRDAAIDMFESRGDELLRDPWAARDDYVNVMLGVWSPAEFLDRHAERSLSDHQRIDLRALLEAQRHAMVMYTSCGWFFGDVSGIESVYGLRSAARVLSLLDELGLDPDVPRQMLDRLGEARSNKSGVGTAADIWRTQVEPSVVTPVRVAAHQTLLAHIRPGAVEPPPGETAVSAGGHLIAFVRRRSDTRGRLGLITARLTVSSEATRRTHDFAVAAVHLGGLDFHGVVGPDPGDAAFAEAEDELWTAFPTAPVARLIRLVSDRFVGTEFGLEQVLPEGRQAIAEAVFSDLSTRFREAYARLYHDHRRILEMLKAAGYELNRDLRAAAELTLAAELDTLITNVDGDDETAADPRSFAAVQDLLLLAGTQGYRLDLQDVRDALTRGVAAAARVAARTLSRQDVGRVEQWLDLCGELGLDVDLSRAQEHIYDLAVRAKAGRLSGSETALVAALGQRLGLAPVAWSMPAD
jgi:alpha-amylase/alpha-mannosidase (GH57 family)